MIRVTQQRPPAHIQRHGEHDCTTIVHIHEHTRSFGLKRAQFLGHRQVGIIKATLNALTAIPCEGELKITATRKSGASAIGDIYTWDPHSLRVAQEAVSLIRDDLRILMSLDLGELQLQISCSLERKLKVAA